MKSVIELLVKKRVLEDDGAVREVRESLGKSWTGEGRGAIGREWTGMDRGEFY